LKKLISSQIALPKRAANFFKKFFPLSEISGLNNLFRIFKYIGEIRNKSRHTPREEIEDRD